MIAAKIPNAALSAAATSTIEGIKKPHWIADRSELGSHPLGHRRRGAKAVPTAVPAEADQLLHSWSAVINAADAAEREQLANSGFTSQAGTPDEACIQNEVDCVHDLGEDRLRSGRLRIAQRHAHESRQRFTWAVRVDCADRAWMPGVHRVEKVESLASADLSDDDAVRRHSKGLVDEHLNRYRATSLGVRWPPLERYAIAELTPQVQL